MNIQFQSSESNANLSMLASMANRKDEEIKSIAVVLKQAVELLPIPAVIIDDELEIRVSSHKYREYMNESGTRGMGWCKDSAKEVLSTGKEVLSSLGGSSEYKASPLFHEGRVVACLITWLEVEDERVR